MKTKFLKKTATSLGFSLLSLLPSLYEKPSYSSSETGYNAKQEMEIIQKSMLEDLVKKERNFLFEQRAEEQSSDEIKAPSIKVKKDHCAEYATKAAYKLFNKKYNRHDAWNLQYTNQIVNELDSIGEIKELIIRGYLKPGMLIGTKRPLTQKQLKKYGKDLKGNTPEYTHVVVYAGVNDNLEPEFVQQYGRKIEKLTLSELVNKDLIPVEILDTSDKQLEEKAQN
jgi:hypothetical protein